MNFFLIIWRSGLDDIGRYLKYSPGFSKACVHVSVRICDCFQSKLFDFLPINPVLIIWQGDALMIVLTRNKLSFLKGELAYLFAFKYITIYNQKDAYHFSF